MARRHLGLHPCASLLFSPALSRHTRVACTLHTHAHIHSLIDEHVFTCSRVTFVFSRARWSSCNVSIACLLFIFMCVSVFCEGSGGHKWCASAASACSFGKAFRRRRAFGKACVWNALTGRHPSFAPDTTSKHPAHDDFFVDLLSLDFCSCSLISLMMWWDKSPSGLPFLDRYGYPHAVCT